MENSNHVNKSAPELGRVKFFLRRIFFFEYSPRYIRLEGDLATFKEELAVESGHGKNQEWKQKALVLANKAEEKLLEKNIDEGWKLLHAAKRKEAYGGKEIRKALVIELREEADKLKEWRKNSVLKLIGVSGEKKASEITPEELEKAMEIKDEFYHALYYTNRLTNAQFVLLFSLLFTWILAVIVYIMVYKDLNAAYQMATFNLQNFTGILLFGLIGSTTSSIFHFRNSQSSTRIPEVLSNNSITLSRIFVGAGFSIFIFVLLNSSIVKAADIFSFKFGSSCYEFFTIAFVSGFSERFALNSLQKVIGKKEP